MKKQFAHRQYLGLAGAAVSLVLVGLSLFAYRKALATPLVINSGSFSHSRCSLGRVVLICLQDLSVELTSEPTSFAIDTTKFGQQLANTVERGADTLLLELDVEAERPPGAVWEVYVGLPAKATPDTSSVYYVGNVALYGAGIRSEAKERFKPAHFAFRLNRAVQAVLKAGSDKSLSVTFVPHGVLVDGRPSRPSVQSPVRVDQAMLSIGTN